MDRLLPYLPTEITDINQIHGSDVSTAQRMRKARRNSRSCKHCGPAGPIELCYACSFYPVLHSATASTQCSYFYFTRPTNVVEHKCKKRVTSVNSRTHGNCSPKSEEWQRLRASRSHTTLLSPLISICFDAAYCVCAADTFLPSPNAKSCRT